jgi:hypothetical protein
MAVSGDSLSGRRAQRRDLRLTLEVAALVDDARALEPRSPFAARRFYLAAANLERRRRREARAAGLGDDAIRTPTLDAIREALRRLRLGGD